MDRDETAALLGMLAQVYADFTVDDDAINTWAMLLADMPYAVVEPAAVELMRTRATAPSVAAIRKRVVERSVALPSADEAWADVRRALGQLARGEQPAWSHALIGRVARNIGLYQLLDSENQTSDRARFVDLYSAAREREHAAAVADYRVVLRPCEPALEASTLADDLCRVLALPAPPAHTPVATGVLVPLGT